MSCNAKCTENILWIPALKCKSLQKLDSTYQNEDQIFVIFLVSLHEWSNQLCFLVSVWWCCFTLLCCMSSYEPNLFSTPPIPHSPSCVMCILILAFTFALFIWTNVMFLIWFKCNIIVSAIVTFFLFDTYWRHIFKVNRHDVLLVSVHQC